MVDLPERRWWPADTLARGRLRRRGRGWPVGKEEVSAPEARGEEETGGSHSSSTSSRRRSQSSPTTGRGCLLGGKREREEGRGRRRRWQRKGMWWLARKERGVKVVAGGDGGRWRRWERDMHPAAED
jgi:hypothetical protein